MKRHTQLLIVLALLCIAIPSQAQTQTRFNCEGKRFAGKYLLHKPTDHISNIVDRILAVSNIPDADNYVICRVKKGFDNVVINPQHKFIIYDEAYLYSIARTAGEMHWGLVAVMAHEMGHHVYSAEGSKALNSTRIQLYEQLNKQKELEESRMNELKADAFAGRVMVYLGASLANAKAFMSGIKSPDNDTWSSHPSGPKRVNAVTIGWLEACKVLGKECNNPVLKNREPKVTTAPKHTAPPKTPHYERFISLADNFKGKRVTTSYCRVYASVGVLQAGISQKAKCGYTIDANTASQWSLNWQPQYDWCMKMSSYATQRETQYREKKLMECLR